MASFREKLAGNAAKGNGSNNGEVKVINMQNPNNQGSIVFIPFSPNTGQDSVQVLNDVMEVAYFYEGKDKESGKAYKQKRWYQLLNREDYKLSADQMDEYKYLRSLGKKLSGHKFSKNAKQNQTEVNARIRFKNYTCILAWVIDHKNLAGKKVNENIPALIVFSSANFDKEFNKQLEAKDKKSNGSEWQARLFNDQLKRKMYMSVDYKFSDNKKIIGYMVNVSIEKFDEDTVRYTGGNEELLDLTKNADALSKLGDPISTFVGHGGSYYSDKVAAKIKDRLHVQLNKYCGGSYPTDSNEPIEDKSAPIDPVGNVNPDNKADEIPTDEDKKSNDAWD